MLGEFKNLLNLPTTLFIVFLIIIVVPTLVYETRRKSLRIPHFDGPSGLPFVGNLYDIKSNAAEQYRRWSYSYGNVFQIQLGNISVLVVNNAATAKAIFSGHSNALSSRPTFFTFHKIISKTAGVTMGTAPYSKSVSRSRKATPLGKPAVRIYVTFLDKETRDFVQQCLDTGERPVDPLLMLQRMSLSIDLTLCWGRRISLSDPLLAEIVHVEHEIVNMRNTMTNIQDCIPILRFQWNSTTQKALELRQRRDAYFAQLNDELDERIRNGTHTACIRSELLSRTDLDEEELKLTCLTFISAGMAPTVATLQWSIALLAQRPDIQDAAFQAIRDHSEKNTVLGDEEDDQGCQYIVALAKECLRYFTVARTALPRSTVKEFSYDGKVIPVGTTVFLNAWACNLDPSIWQTPHVFDPTRWLTNPDTPLFTYGVGARSCSGIALANRFLYLFFLRLICAFEILPQSYIDVDPISGCKSADDLVSSPKRYTVSFKPRNAALLRQALQKS